jgi:hypothetical protein
MGAIQWRYHFEKCLAENGWVLRIVKEERLVTPQSLRSRLNRDKCALAKQQNCRRYRSVSQTDICRFRGQRTVDRLDALLCKMVLLEHEQGNRMN